MLQAQSLVSEVCKQPLVEVTELKAESPVSQGSTGTHELSAPTSPLLLDDSPKSQDVGVVEVDLSNQSVMGERSPDVVLRSRRAVSSGQASSDGHDFDASISQSDDGKGRIESLTISKRVDGFSSRAMARRTWSSETTGTSIVVSRLTSSELKGLPLEERLIKSRSSLKEIERICSLSSGRDRVTLQHVFDIIDKIRMQQVPRQWSPVDKRLKQAQCSAERIADFISLIKRHSSDTDSMASMFYLCCALTVQRKVLDSASLDSLLSILNRASIIAQHVKTAVSATQTLSSELFHAALSKVVHSLRCICATFVEVVDELRIGKSFLPCQIFAAELIIFLDDRKSSKTSVLQLDKHFEADITSLTWAAHAACEELWLVSLRESADTTLQSCHGRVLGWLNGHQQHYRGPWRGRGIEHQNIFVFDCVESIVTKFLKAPSTFLLVTGEIGYGEENMALNLIERLQLAVPIGSKLLHASLVETLHETNRNPTVSFLKSLIYQLLDQSVGNTGLLAAISLVMSQSEHESAVRTEELLWELLTKQCPMVHGHITIVVDGMSTGGNDNPASGTHVLTKLQQLISRCGNIRCLALADPNASSLVQGAQIYVLSRGDIRRNARLLLQMSIKASASLSVLSAHLRQQLLQHAAERSWTSLLEAKLVLRLLESEYDHGRMADIILKTPKSLHGMLDHMILKIDFKNPEVHTLLSWLLVGKRSIEVSELERHGSVTTSNWLGRIRSCRPVSSNSSLASIITVHAGHVQFVDSTVKARMYFMALNGKIPLSLHMAHRQVSLDCLKHARQHVLQHKIDLVIKDPSNSKWGSASSYSDFDNLLAYSVGNWYYHYERSLTSAEKSSRHVPADVSAELPDSVLMALAEWYYLRAEHIGRSDFIQALSKILALRRSVFGSQAPSVIQTTINMAHFEQVTSSSGTRVVDTERLVAAFDAIIARYGDPSPQATVGAKYLFSILKSQKSFSFKSFTVHKYLWTVYKQELGDSHEDTLFVAQRLAELYSAEMKFAEAADTFRAMYEACCRTKGLFASKSISIFHLLIDALEHSDNMSEAHQLCEDVLDAAPRLETWNDGVLSAVCRIVRHFHDRGMTGGSKGKLQQLWTLLQGRFKLAHDHSQLLVAFMQVTLQLARKLKDLSIQSEAASTLTSFWAATHKYVTKDRHYDFTTLVQLREMAQLLLALDHHEKALSILRVVCEIHRSAAHDHPHETVQAYSALITCYKLTNNSIEDFAWADILESVLATASSQGHMRAETVYLCRDLAFLYRSKSQWKVAISICHRSLDVLWPQLSIRKEAETLYLPASFSRECIQMAVTVAQMHIKINKKKQADSLLKAIIGSCRHSILKWTTSWTASSIDIASVLSLALEEIGLAAEALEFWNSIFSHARHHLGDSHSFPLHVAAAIVRLSLQLDLSIEDEAVWKVLEIEPDDGDWRSISLRIEGLLALCRSHGTKPKKSKSLLVKWYERLWTYYSDWRHDLAMDARQGFEIFQEYCAVLVSMKEISTAIESARKLRAISLSDLSRHDVWYLRASLELAKLLELDDKTVRDAVDIHDELNEIGLLLSTTDEAILTILRISQERLSILVASKTFLHHRAEGMLIRAWRQSVRRNSYSHQQSISSLQKVFAFWASIGKVEFRQRAIYTLKEAILGAISSETNASILFQLAESFCSLSEMMDIAYKDLGFISSVRASIFEYSEKMKVFFNSEYPGEKEKTVEVSGSYDRRCLILIYALESMFQGKRGNGLFEDTLTRVFTEAALYEAWLRVSRDVSNLADLMTAGTRLIKHLEKHKLQSESTEIKGRLWTLFCQTIGQSDEKKTGATYRFFEDVLTVTHQRSVSLSLFETALVRIQRLADAGSYHACLCLSEWIYSYVMTSLDLEENSAAASLLLKLATLLYSCSEAGQSSELRINIEVLATRVSTLAMRYTTEIDISVTNISHLTFILGIAGKQKNYKTLRKILELLWNSRNTYDVNLTPTTTVSIGQRLAEVYFACGEYAPAFALLEDITYNLKDVFGVNHPTTLQCQHLHASMHESLGQRNLAIGVRFSMLKDALCGVREAATLHESNVSLEESTRFYVTQLQSLRHEYATTKEYTWHLEKNKTALEEMIGKVKTLSDGKASGPDAESVLDVSKWNDLKQVEAGDGVFEAWRAPDDWTVDIEVDNGYDTNARIAEDE